MSGEGTVIGVSVDAPPALFTRVIVLATDEPEIAEHWRRQQAHPELTHAFVLGGRVRVACDSIEELPA